MSATRSTHPRVDQRKPVDAGAPVDARASEGRATEPDVHLGHSDQDVGPSLREVDPWITIYLSIVKAIMERERRRRGARSPAA
jgi:hypothetical protein